MIDVSLQRDILTQMLIIQVFNGNSIHPDINFDYLTFNYYSLSK